jgi:arthrofactin-type cyclic lipopeptide synthetase C
VSVLLQLVQIYELVARAPLRITAKELALLDHDAQLKLVLTRLVEAGVMPATTTAKALLGILQVFETNVNTAYHPGGEYGGPLHLVGVQQPTEWHDGQSMPSELLLQLWHQHAPRASLWNSHGNHMSVLDVPCVTELAQWLHGMLRP